jgi:hypothetical protein
MTKEWDFLDLFPCTNYLPTANTSVTQNRGYFINESIEGGSLLYLNATIIAPPLTTAPSSVSQVYSKIYPVGLVTNFSLGVSGRQMVMRSDRLPSSTNTQSNLSNNYVLFENGNITLYGVDSGGQVTTYNTGGSNIPDNNSEDLSEDYPDNPVLESFQCENMVPLECYSESTGVITIAPPGDSCYTNAGGLVMENGCYNFINIPLITIVSDTKHLAQWFARQTTMYGLCRNIFSHLFTNNWINGTLYTFPFKNNTFFNSNNEPYSSSCGDVVFYDTTNNNFYYRSAPYTYGNKFIGRSAPDYNKYKGNYTNIMFPTTIMDLGPKQKYLQEVSVTNNYDGYVLNKLLPTTYNDVSELLNLLVIARLVNTLNLGGVLSFFNRRDNLFVDGDYAQLIATNSQLGVYPFEPGYYSGNEIYSYSQIFGLNNVIGVFFKSDLQVRDYITPKRTIYTGLGPFSTINCSLDNISVFTQEVPFYQWEIDIKPTVFGGQANNWVTSNFYSGGVFSHKYQDLDRLLQQSRYFRTNNFNQTDYFKGYIYSVNGSGNIDPDSSYWYPNLPPRNLRRGS